MDGKWVMNDASKLPDSEAMLENIPALFKGDFSELRNIIGYQPNNKVKVMFGIRTADDNKQYQTVYTRMFLKNNVSDYSRLDADIAAAREAGSYANTEFDTSDLHEYVVVSSSFSQQPATPAAAPKTPWGAKQ